MSSHSDLIEHWPAMVRAANSILASRHDAEDCAAASLAELWERPVAGCANLESLLVTVAKRRAIDLVRTREAERRRDTRIASRVTLVARDVAEEVADRAEAQWFDAAARRELRPHVYALLERLASDVPIGEAAAELGMSRRSAESHLLRARRTLREVLPKAMAGIAVTLAGARRFAARAAGPAVVAASATCLVLVPSVDGPLSDGRTPGAVEPVHGVLRPATPIEMAAQTGSSAVVRASTPHGPAARKTSEVQAPRVVEARGPGKSSVYLREGDTGGHEEGPVEILVACVRDLRLDHKHVGCSG